MNTLQFRNKYINDGPIMTTTPDMAFDMPSGPTPPSKPTAPKSGATKHAPQTLTLSSRYQPGSLITPESANADAEANVTYVPPAGKDITVVPLKKPISPIVYIGGGLILLKILKVF